MPDSSVSGLGPHTKRPQMRIQHSRSSSSHTRSDERLAHPPAAAHRSTAEAAASPSPYSQSLRGLAVAPLVEPGPR